MLQKQWQKNLSEIFLHEKMFTYMHCHLTVLSKVHELHSILQKQNVYKNSYSCDIMQLMYEDLRTCETFDKRFLSLEGRTFANFRQRLNQREKLTQQNGFNGLKISSKMCFRPYI
jgi:hypothetical protein